MRSHSARIVASVLLTSENTGVMPLPPAYATRGRSSASTRRQNEPGGRVASSGSPGRSRSCIQPETSPPGTRLTVTHTSPSVSGEDDIE